MQGYNVICAGKYLNEAVPDFMCDDSVFIKWIFYIDNNYGDQNL